MLLAKFAVLFFLATNFNKVQSFDSARYASASASSEEEIDYSPAEIELMGRLYEQGKYMWEIFKMVRSFVFHPNLVRSFFKPPHFTP